VCVFLFHIFYIEAPEKVNQCVCVCVCVCGLLVVFLKHRLHLSDYATFPFDFHKLFTAHRLCKEMGS